MGITHIFCAINGGGKGVCIFYAHGRGAGHKALGEGDRGLREVWGVDFFEEKGKMKK